jgi:CRP-like cAMP-binding protein
VGNPLVLKLEHGAELLDDDRTALDHAVADARRHGAHEDIIREGERPEEVHVVLEGFAFRYKTLADGQRQIMAYLVPGDLCDLHVSILGEMDHSIGTAGTCRIAHVSRAAIDELTQRHPRINRALWWATLVDEGVLREWLVNMGRREAEQQMAHLFCELLVRLQSVGLAENDAFTLPLTQSELADTLGISAVHVNRTLQALRGRGLVSLKGKRLMIHDVEALKRFSDFDPNYLHLQKRQARAVTAQPHRGETAEPVRRALRR